MLTDNQLLKIVRQIKEEKDNMEASLLIRKLITEPALPPCKDRCKLKNLEGGWDVVKFCDMYYATAAGTNTIIKVYKNLQSKKYLYGANIGELIFDLAKHGFVRVHESHVINPICVASYKNEVFKLVMTDGELIPVSKPYRMLINNLYHEIKVPSRNGKLPKA